MCGSFSLLHICKTCQIEELEPSLYITYIDDVKVLSFYTYDKIKILLHTKHTDIGYYILNILASIAMKKFAMNFEYTSKIAVVGIDDHNGHGYSHTAILVKFLKSKVLIPHFNILRSQSTYSYSSKTVKQRESNPRNFIYHDIKLNEIILIDDIITTGKTLQEAMLLLKQNNKKVLFCVTLAKAKL